MAATCRLTLKSAEASSFQEKKSLFKLEAFPLKAKKEFLSRLERIRQENPKARHILYIYRLLDGGEAAEEDQEPVSSMHKLLSLAQDKNIVGFGIVIVRYFGGILLGASNLDRIYFRLGTSALKSENLAAYRESQTYEGTFASSYYASLKKALSDAGGVILKEEFLGPEITWVFSLPKGEENLLSSFRKWETVDLV